MAIYRHCLYMRKCEIACGNICIYVIVFGVKFVAGLGRFKGVACQHIVSQTWAGIWSGEGCGCDVVYGIAAVRRKRKVYGCDVWGCDDVDSYCKDNDSDGGIGNIFFEIQKITVERIPFLVAQSVRSDLSFLLNSYQKCWDVRIIYWINVRWQICVPNVWWLTLATFCITCLYTRICTCLWSTYEYVHLKFLPRYGVVFLKCLSMYICIHIYA